MQHCLANGHSRLHVSGVEQIDGNGLSAQRADELSLLLTARYTADLVTRLDQGAQGGLPEDPGGSGDEYLQGATFYRPSQ